MSTPTERQTELRDFLQRLSDDALPPEESQRLNDLLHGDPEACERYLDHVTLDAHLRSEFGGQRPGLETLPAFVRNSGEPRAESREPNRSRLFFRPVAALRSFCSRGGAGRAASCWEVCSGGTSR